MQSATHRKNEYRGPSWQDGGRRTYVAGGQPGVWRVLNRREQHPRGPASCRLDPFLSLCPCRCGRRLDLSLSLCPCRCGRHCEPGRVLQLTHLIREEVGAQGALQRQKFLALPWGPGSTGCSWRWCPGVPVRPCWWGRISLVTPRGIPAAFIHWHRWHGGST